MLDSYGIYMLESYGNFTVNLGTCDVGNVGFYAGT
jgi:hypothetical protein